MRKECNKKTFQKLLKNGRKMSEFEIVNKEAVDLPEMIQNWKEIFCITCH